MDAGGRRRERRATLMEARPRVNATRQRRRRHKSPRLSGAGGELKVHCGGTLHIYVICSALAMARYGCELGGDASWQRLCDILRFPVKSSAACPCRRERQD